MASVSKAVIPGITQGVNQGDIFMDVSYSYIDSEDFESVEIFEFVFPYAIVVSQSCDVDFMNSFEPGENDMPVKFMPGILMCPLYQQAKIKHGAHLQSLYDELERPLDKGSAYFPTEDRKVTDKDQHVRFHALTVQADNGSILIGNAVLDFKHLFTVPMKYLRNNRAKRICRIEDIYIDQIVNKLGAFISRIGLPN